MSQRQFDNQPPPSIVDMCGAIISAPNSTAALSSTSCLCACVVRASMCVCVRACVCTYRGISRKEEQLIFRGICVCWSYSPSVLALACTRLAPVRGECRQAYPSHFGNTSLNPCLPLSHFP